MVRIRQALGEAAGQIAAHLHLRRRGAAHGTPDALTQATNDARKGPGHVPRPQDLGNASAHLSAQHVVARGRGNLARARGHERLDALTRRFQAPVALAGTVQRTRRLRKRRGNCTREGAPHNGRALRRIVTDALQERAERRDRRDGQAAIRQLLLGDRDDRNVTQASSTGESRQVRAHLVLRAGGHSIQHNGNAQAPPGRLLQVSPRNGVGVARGARDKDPQVRAVKQLRRQAAVAFLDRVDVGGVQNTHARPHHVVDRNRHGVQTCALPALMLGQARQHTIR